MSWKPNEDLKSLSSSLAFDVTRDNFEFLDLKLSNLLSNQLDGGDAFSDWNIGKLVDGGGAYDY